MGQPKKTKQRQHGIANMLGAGWHASIVLLGCFLQFLAYRVPACCLGGEQRHGIANLLSAGCQASIVLLGRFLQFLAYSASMLPW